MNEHLVAFLPDDSDLHIDYGEETYKGVEDLAVMLAEAFLWVCRKDETAETAICRIFYEFNYPVDPEIINDFYRCSSLIQGYVSPEQLEPKYQEFLQTVESITPNFYDLFEAYKSHYLSELNNDLPW
ncbi:hypothetical protein cce_4881 [Crocosphaera subtropica ATCC 51142]|uniref:Uncharacterized protein n=1 Tax=Crocosphaera subtropica (strain ATCC 51142 / BH68) TaxID=43989 RepID=B1X266_CROS5|nr:hypothetical protein [Crocosphaera subtropica]ACB54227.1 hypothetical protein cce_4881 [Crocosphaera subtropica ATCC 51142]